MCCMHIEQMDLSLLKSLDVLLAERHVSRAAARHHLSQPAMSRALRPDPAQRLVPAASPPGMREGQRLLDL